MTRTLPPDIEIARRANTLPIDDIAAKLGIPDAALEHYGKLKAKVSLDYYHALDNGTAGKLILVTAITPTPAGEGKTTTSIGLCDALNRIGKKASVCLREPSLGALFWHERRGRRRRLFTGRAHGGHQPALHRRFSRH